MKTAWSVNTAAAIATMTGNATMAIIAATELTATATASTIAANAASVWKMAVCVTTVNSVLNAVNVRTGAADVMKWAKSSAQTAAKNAPAVTGSVMHAANVPTVSETRRTAPTAISVSSVRIGYAIAATAAAIVRLAVRAAARSVPTAIRTSFVFPA